MPTSAPQSDAPKSRRRSFFGLVLRLTLILLVGAIVAAGLVTLLATQGMLTDRIATLATERLGRPVTLGDARVGLGTPLTVHLENVRVANRAGVTGPDPFRAATVDAKVRLNWTPPFAFDPVLEDVALGAPEINVRTDESGKSNLDFGSSAGGDGGFALWPATASVKDGKLTYAKTEATEPLAFEAIDATLASDATSGKTSGKGKLTHKGEVLDFDATFADLRIATAGLPTAVALTVGSPRFKADLAGDAVLGADSQFTGKAKAETPSLAGLAQWLSPGTNAAGAEMAASLDGPVRVRAGSVGFEGTDFDVGGTKARVTGALALQGERPKLTGTLEMPLVDLSRFAGVPASAAVRSAAPEAEESEEPGTLEFIVEPNPDALIEDLKAIESGAPVTRAAPEPTIETVESAEPAAEAAASEEDGTRALKSSPSKPAWSNQAIEVRALKAVDLDVMLNAAAVAFGDLDIRNARIKAALDNGRVAADIEDMDVAGGKAKGKIAINGSGAKPAADINVDLTGVEAEPVITQFAGKPFLSGTSDATVNVKASGDSLNALISSLEGTAKFKMAKGAFRGIDIKREADSFCLSELVSGYMFGTKKTFKIDLKQKTGFEKLEAEYKIRNGVLRSTPEAALGGSEVEIRSRGEVSVAKKLLSQNVRLKVVPPPRVPTIPVIIAGSWSKLSFKLDTASVDWLAIINAAFSGCDSTRGLAAKAAEPPPPVDPAVQAAIEGVLRANPGTLTEEGRTALRAFVPEAPAAPAPEQPTEAPAAPSEAPAADPAAPAVEPVVP